MSRNPGASKKENTQSQQSEYSESNDSINLNDPAVQQHLWDKWKLFKSLAQDDPKRIEEKRYLFNAYKPSMARVARGYHRHSIPAKSLVSEEDAVQVALSRMWEDMEVFDLNYGIPFERFYNSSKNSRLLGAIKDETRRFMNFPKDIAPLLRDYHAKVYKLRQKIKRDPTLEDYLDEYGWDQLEVLQEPLLFSQVFSQSNAKPGEHSEEELRFSGDKRRKEALPEVNLKQAISQVNTKITVEQRLMALIPDPHDQLAVLAYRFWGWSLVKIADATGVSVTLAAKRKKRGEKALEERIGSLDRGLKLFEMWRALNGEAALPTKQPPKIVDNMHFDFPEENP